MQIWEDVCEEKIIGHALKLFSHDGNKTYEIYRLWKFFLKNLRYISRCASPTFCCFLRYFQGQTQLFRRMK